MSSTRRGKVPPSCWERGGGGTGSKGRGMARERLAQGAAGARIIAPFPRLAARGAQGYGSSVPPAAPLHPIARLPEEWSAVISALGERAYAKKQVFDWIHRRGVVDAA